MEIVLPEETWLKHLQTKRDVALPKIMGAQGGHLFQTSARMSVYECLTGADTFSHLASTYNECRRHCFYLSVLA